MAAAAAAAAGTPAAQHLQPSASSGQAATAPPPPDGLVELSVGGMLFTTSRATLEEIQPQSMLAALVNGRHGPPRRDAQVRRVMEMCAGDVLQPLWGACMVFGLWKVLGVSFRNTLVDCGRL